MYWVINRCCDLVQLFRWMIAQSHRNCKVLQELQCCRVRILEFGSSPYIHSSEILPPTQHPDKFNLQQYATFTHITKLTAENGACNLHLPWSKTQKGWGDDMWIPCQETPLDPIHTLHKHFLKNTLSLRDSITAYWDDQGKLLTLTRSKFMCWTNAILRARGKGYPWITGHCFRIGGTTFYLISGVPPDIVRATL